MCVNEKCTSLCTDSKGCNDAEECRGTWDPQQLTWTAPLLCRSERCECSDDASVCVNVSGAGLSCAQYGPCNSEGCDEGYTCTQLAGQEACVCDNGSCGPACDDDDDCQGALSCRKGRCATKECSGPGSCRDGLACGLVTDDDGVRHQQCVLPGPLSSGERCAATSDCKTGICELIGGTRNTCLASCVDRRDCAGDESCVRFSTLTEFDIGVCADVQNTCQEGESGVQTAEGLLCSTGQSCEEQADCLGSMQCAAGLCACLPEVCAAECDTDRDCSSESVCVDGACHFKQPCEGQEQCQEGELCVVNAGEPRAGRYCTPRGGAASGEVCEVATDCASGTCAGVCVDLCVRSADCGGDECVLRQVDALTFGACVETQCGCAEDEVCSLNDLCVAAPVCSTSADCDDALSCLGGVCLQSCDRTQDCGGGQQCTLVSELGGYVCSDGDCDCLADEVCRDGHCESADACRIDAQCDGKFCVSGQCQDECTTNAQCPGQECVRSPRVERLLRTCQDAVCSCDDPDAWCLPDSVGGGRCVRGEDCADCSPNDGYECANLQIEAAGQSVSACRCASNQLCGKTCSKDSDCSEGLTCAPHGRCDTPGACRTTADCASGEDCFVSPLGVLELGECRPAQCFCKGQDLCDPANVGGECVRQVSCSVLEPDCPDYYRCSAALSMCVCDDFPLCGARCDDESECQPRFLCRDQRCELLPCDRHDDCSTDLVCGGDGEERSCSLPGPVEDGAQCDTWADCQSGYCFAGNSCATRCTASDECPSGWWCQLFQPDLFPGQRPICRPESTRCEDNCTAAQWCDNAEQPRCFPDLPPAALEPDAEGAVAEPEPLVQAPVVAEPAGGGAGGGAAFLLPGGDGAAGP